MGLIQVPPSRDKLVRPEVVVAMAGTDIDLTGLNGDRDGVYRIVGEGTAAAVATVQFRFNDNAATNIQRFSQESGGAPGNAALDGPGIIFSNGGGFSAICVCRSGSVRTTYVNSWGQGADNRQYFGHNVWTTTTGNITSIKLVASANFSVGFRVRVTLA